MWTYYQFILLLGAIALITTYMSENLPRFAAYSELVWVTLYVLSAWCGTSLDEPLLLSTPLLVLVLAGVEAVVLWTLIVYSAQLKL